jgi:hypothetical protein
MKSKKHLFVVLDKFFNTDKYTKNKLNSVGNETYGKKSMIYVDASDSKIRVKLEAFLQADGFVVNTGYYPGSGTVEVQVSYFRGDNWNA